MGNGEECSAAADGGEESDLGVGGDFGFVEDVSVIDRRETMMKQIAKPGIEFEQFGFKIGNRRAVCDLDICGTHSGAIAQAGEEVNFDRVQDNS